MTVTRGANLLTYAGDNARYPQVIANNMNNPRLSVSSADIGTLWLSYPGPFTPGTQGIITANHLDALAAANGGVLFQFGGNNAFAVVEGPDDSGPFSQWGTGNLSFMACAPDGQTNPLTVSRD